MTQKKQQTHVFVHVMGPKNHGGIGIAAWHYKGDSFVRFSTSVCSDDDQYSKKTAVSYLRDARKKGAFIKLPLPDNTLRNKMTHRDLRQAVVEMFV